MSSPGEQWTTPQESLTSTQEDRKRHKWEDKDPTSINGIKRGFETCWTLITVQVCKTQIQPTPPSWLCLPNANACFLVPSVQWMKKNFQSSIFNIILLLLHVALHVTHIKMYVFVAQQSCRPWANSTMIINLMVSGVNEPLCQLGWMSIN